VHLRHDLRFIDDDGRLLTRAHERRERQQRPSLTTQRRRIQKRDANAVRSFDDATSTTANKQTTTTTTMFENNNYNNNNQRQSENDKSERRWQLPLNAFDSAAEGARFRRHLEDRFVEFAFDTFAASTQQQLFALVVLYSVLFLISDHTDSFLRDDAHTSVGGVVVLYVDVVLYRYCVVHSVLFLISDHTDSFLRDDAHTSVGVYVTWCSCRHQLQLQTETRLPHNNTSSTPQSC
jgi:hypothetical protein